jgi:hypothetical protein
VWKRSGPGKESATMDVEKLLRLVVNFVALVVLAVATAVALVVAARGDAGVGSRAPTVSTRGS